jgi:hypothetical protein
MASLFGLSLQASWELILNRYGGGVVGRMEICGLALAYLQGRKFFLKQKVVDRYLR